MLVEMYGKNINKNYRNTRAEKEMKARKIDYTEVDDSKMKFEIIGTRIREKREQKLWSQEMLACKVNLSSVYIGMIERGEKLPRLKTFLRIVECLDTTPNELMVGLFPDRQKMIIYEYKGKIDQLAPNEKTKIHKIIDAFLEKN